jgi:hypothetical protein
MALQTLVDRARRKFGAFVMQAGARITPSSVPRSSKPVGEGPKVNEGTALVITTFEARQFRYCLPLIASLRAHEISTPIVVVVNGEHPQAVNDTQRREFSRELLTYPQVFPVVLRKRVGLARLWNLGIQIADAPVCVVLNDDLALDRNQVWRDIAALASAAQANGIALGSGSWSHFAISRKCINEIGWFEERLLGFGEEDADYTVRFFEVMNRLPQTVSLSAMHHLHAPERQSLPSGHGKYSLYNKVFVATKYSSPQTSDALREPHAYRRVFEEVAHYPGEDFRWKHQEGLLELRDEQGIQSAIEAAILDNRRRAGAP